MSKIAPMTDEELVTLDERLRDVEPNVFHGRVILGAQGIFALRERLRVAEAKLKRVTTEQERLVKAGRQVIMSDGMGTKELLDLEIALHELEKT